MSGIAAIYNFDRRPVDLALLERITEAAAYRGPDAGGVWHEGRAGLGHRMLHTTPESLRETQPLVDTTAKLALVMDGRVDNRDELITDLRAHGVRLADETDAEIVLRSYELWREDSPRRIIGDFAFVIWDGREQQLFCARDPFGIKSFYYHRDARRFLCGSELHQILEDATVPHEPNEGMVGEYLADRIRNREETLFNGIFRLEPAHYLIIRESGLVKRRYYDIDPENRIVHGSDDEYAAHFLELFKQAVACRMRSCTPVGAELSGGLDSSSVACTVQLLLKSGACAAPGFETFSAVYPGLPCDESEYIASVVEKAGLKANLLRPGPTPPGKWVTEARRFGDFPGYANGLMNEAVLDSVRAKGMRVVLTGVGGDEFLTGSFRHCADLLSRLELRALIGYLRDAFSRYGLEPWRLGDLPAVAAIMRDVVRPLVPLPAVRALKRLRRRDPVPSFINREFARRSALAERLTVEEKVPNAFSFAQAHMYGALLDGRLCQAAEQGSRSDGAYGIESRHPFYDRRIVEFAFGIPEEQRHWRGLTKLVLRNAMRGILPEKVRQRRTKAEFSSTVLQELEALGGERLFASLAIAELGWVNQEEVRRMYRRAVAISAADGDPALTRLRELWRLFGIDLWYRVGFLDRGGQKTRTCAA
jgi:asparagine synthase (glutamine-hydrolysing)